MNRSDLSDDLKNDEEEEVNSKYQPPKAVPISEIIAKDSNDPSLNKYKQQLIGDAINVIIGKLNLMLCILNNNFFLKFSLFKKSPVTRVN